MRFHILGIPHTRTTKEFCACAYTMKIWRLCEMLMSLGHEVYHYGAEGSDPICTENIDVVSRDLQRKIYGDYDWRKEFFKWSQDDEVYQKVAENSIREIRKRMQKNDFLLVQGYWHQRIVEALKELIQVEPGIGYEGVMTNYKVFESYAWMHYVYGMNKWSLGKWFDAVIPNYFDLGEFEYRENKDDYFLYLGRLIPNKGLQIIVDIANELKVKVLVVGQGKMQLSSPYIRYVGFADVEERKKLLSRARALFAPTYYIEPFGGAAIEAQLSGTPVITSDWGAFSETVLHGKTGYRCRTFDHFLWATKNINRIKPQACRIWAENYDMHRIKYIYQEYFDTVLSIYDGRNGWYNKNPKRDSLDWLSKQYV